MAGRAAQLAASEGPRNPEMVATYAALHRVQGHIAAQMANIVQSLHTEVQSARAQQTALQERLEALRQEVGQENSAELGLQGLHAKAHATRSLYDSFLTRATELANVAGIQEPDAALVSNATPPLGPSAPQRTRIRCRRRDPVLRSGCWIGLPDRAAARWFRLARAIGGVPGGTNHRTDPVRARKSSGTSRKRPCRGTVRGISRQCSRLLARHGRGSAKGHHGDLGIAERGEIRAGLQPGRQCRAGRLAGSAAGMRLPAPHLGAALRAAGVGGTKRRLDRWIAWQQHISSSRGATQAARASGGTSPRRSAGTACLQPHDTTVGGVSKPV